LQFTKSDKEQSFMVFFVNGKLLVNGAEVPDKVLAAVPLV
jgi:hypothetical protein